MKTREEYLEQEVEILKLILQDAFKTIGFYGLRENWAFSYSNDKKIVYREIIFDGYGYHYPIANKSKYFGGKLAREFIKKYHDILINEYQMTKWEKGQYLPEEEEIYSFYDESSSSSET